MFVAVDRLDGDGTPPFCPPLATMFSSVITEMATIPGTVWLLETSDARDRVHMRHLTLKVFDMSGMIESCLCSSDEWNQRRFVFDVRLDGLDMPC